MMGKSWTFRGLAPLSAGAALALSLAGCAETPASRISAVASDPVVSIRPSGYSPRPAALAVTRMEGAPTPLQSQFMAYFNADVAQQDVTITDAAAARYLARGYISAFPVDGGAKLTYVWDIYDRQNQRAQRLNDEIALKGDNPDPWALVDGAALAALAQRSAGELAAYLSNTPEALARAESISPAATASAAAAATAEAVRDAAPAEPPAAALSYSGAR